VPEEDYEPIAFGCLLLLVGLLFILVIVGALWWRYG